MSPKEFFDRLEKAELRARLAEERIAAYRLEALHLQIAVLARDREVMLLKALLAKQAAQRSPA